MANASHFGKQVAIPGALALIAAAIVGAIIWSDPALGAGSGVRLLAFNAYPIFMLTVALWALTRRALLAALLGVVATQLVYFASATKQQYLGTPLLPSDFWMIPQLAANPELFSGYVDLPRSTWVGTGILLVVIVVAWRFDWKTFPRTWLLRLPIAAASLLLSYAVFAGIAPTGKAYEGQFGDEIRSTWNPVKLYQISGLVNGIAFLAAQAHNAVGKPNLALLTRFDRVHAAELARRRTQEPPAVLPDIYVIQAESLFDLQTLGGLEQAEIMPNWHALAARGIHGTVDSPAFGGVTIRAEFEMLTGYPMHAFPTVQYPYYGLVQEGINSLPRTLASMGYATTVVHPFKSGFWNRRVVMQQLGFEQLLFDTELGRVAKRGRYAGDEAFFERLLSLQSGQPQFVFAITMENHGPWLRQQVPVDAPGADIVLPQGLPDAARRELRAYLWHVINGDRALGAFADRLLARDKPTYLLVYGDHLPALKATYPHVSFADGNNAHAQPVPFMIVSNQPMQPRRIDNLGMSNLPALLLEAAGLPQKGYFAIDGLLAKMGDGGNIDADARKILDHAAWRDYRQSDHRSDDDGDGDKRATPAVAADRQEGQSGFRLEIHPLPERACRGQAYTARVNWTVPEETPLRGIEVRVNSPQGTLMTQKKAASAAATTGTWVRQGLRFYLVDQASGAVLASAVAGDHQCR